MAIIQNSKIGEFEFKPTGSLQLDATIHKDLARVKDRVKLPANTQDGRRQINITFEEKDLKR